MLKLTHHDVGNVFMGSQYMLKPQLVRCGANRLFFKNNFAFSDEFVVES